MKKLLISGIFALCFGLSQTAFAQIGGYNSFDFLRMSPTARVTAMGGSLVSIHDNDPNMAFMNPACLNDSAHSRISMSFAGYLAGIKYGTVSYAHSIRKVGTIWGGVQYLNYGQMTQADEYGNIQGNFNAGDVNLVVGLSRSFGRFNFGTNFKLVNQTIASQSAWAFAMDFGGMYYHPKSDFGVAFSLRNIGVQINPLTSTGQNAPLPFEIQLGISKRIPFTPMRFTLTVTNLEHPSLIYKDPNAPVEYDLAGKPIEKGSTVADDIFRHTIFGLEFLIGRNIQLRVAYNHRRKQELTTPSQSAFSLRGISFGLGLRIWKFNLDYGYANYHTLGGVHQFSVASFISRFQKPSYQAMKAPSKTKIPKDAEPVNLDSSMKKTETPADSSGKKPQKAKKVKAPKEPKVQPADSSAPAPMPADEPKTKKKERKKGE